MDFTMQTIRTESSSHRFWPG